MQILQRCTLASSAQTNIPAQSHDLLSTAVRTPFHGHHVTVSVQCLVCGANDITTLLQGVLQSLTSTVGSAASTVTSTAKSAVNRLTGDGNNGLTQSYGPTVRPLTGTVTLVYVRHEWLLCVKCWSSARSAACSS